MVERGINPISPKGGWGQICPHRRQERALDGGISSLSSLPSSSPWSSLLSSSRWSSSSSPPWSSLPSSSLGHHHPHHHGHRGERALCCILLDGRGKSGGRVCERKWGRGAPNAGQCFIN